MLKPQTQKLVDSMIAGDKNALARLITSFENNSPEQSDILTAISPHTGKSLVVGITGPPGAGKSTLTGKLAVCARFNNYKIGIIAVDPSSPVSGGAVLGDRVRMPHLDLDEEIFIRSMASRGSFDGISTAVVPAIKLLDAFGKDFIIVETVGAGQTEVGIKKIVDILVLVMTPGYGDSIQLMKAGTLEVADIIVVNKADQPGAEYLISELKMMAEQSPVPTKQAVLATQAIDDTGIETLFNEIITRKQPQTIS